MAYNFFLLDNGKPDVCSKLRGSVNLFGHRNATVIFTAGPMCQRGVADSQRSPERLISASGWLCTSLNKWKEEGGRSMSRRKGINLPKT